MGLEPIPPISPRTRWEPPLAPEDVAATGERDASGGAYQRDPRRRRPPPPAPRDILDLASERGRPPDPGDSEDEESPEGHIDVQA